jgi:hypothetical protein
MIDEKKKKKNQLNVDQTSVFKILYLPIGIIVRDHTHDNLWIIVGNTFNRLNIRTGSVVVYAYSKKEIFE